MKFAGRNGLPGLAMIITGERKVFTASPSIWKAVNTFNIVFPHASKLLVHLTSGYSARWLTQSIHRCLFLYHTYSIMSMTYLIKGVGNSCRQSSKRMSAIVLEDLIGAIEDGGAQG